MSCLLDSSHSRGCKDNASGVYSFYIGNYPSGTTTSADFLVHDSITGEITDLSGTTQAIKLYEFVPEKSSSKFEEEYTVSQEFGSVTYMQKITMVFAGLTQEMQNQVKVLTAGSFLIVVKDKNDQFFLIGENDSVSISGGSASTGQKGGELNGYTLEFTAEEGKPADTVDAAAVSDAVNR